MVELIELTCRLPLSVIARRPFPIQSSRKDCREVSHESQNVLPSDPYSHAFPFQGGFREGIGDVLRIPAVVASVYTPPRTKRVTNKPIRCRDITIHIYRLVFAARRIISIHNDPGSITPTPRAF